MSDLLSITLVQLACVNFFYIGCRAWQTRNVAKSHTALIYLCGFLMAYGEAYVIDTVAEVGHGLMTALALWVGGSTGAVVATKLYDRFLGRILHE